MSIDDDTIEDPDFHDFIDKYDIVILTETWHNNIESINKLKKNFPKTFTFTENARKKKHKKSKRNAGGIVICYKKALSKHITILDKTTENMIWLKVKGNNLNMKQNLIIGGIYNSPQNSSYSKNHHEDLFQKIQDKMLTFRENENILIGGDFNARTGNIQDIIEENEDENNFFSLPEHYHISQYKN